MRELIQINDIFNGKKFYAKRLLIDEYAVASRKLLTAIIENNENNKVILRREQKEIIKQFKGGE